MNDRRDGGGGGGGAASTFYFSAPTRDGAECSAVDAGEDSQCCGRVGDTRDDMTEFMGLAEKVSKFNQEALKHLERQTLNPFSGRFSRSPSPRPKFNKDEYGKPAAGSKSELRGQRAFTHISREILELCEVIHDMGARRRDSDGDECIIIPFGELFAFYTKISDKVVGLLIAAKKRGFVWFEPEILFQRRDDDVLIALLKPMGEIRNIINRQVSASPSPAPGASSDAEKTSPCPTPSPLARQNSNSPSEASSTVDQEMSDPSQTPAGSSEEATPSSSIAEIEPQEPPSATTTVAAETVQTSSTTAPLMPVEEEQITSSEAPVVESKQEPTSEVPTELELSPSVSVAEPPVEDKGISSNELPLPSEEDQPSPTSIIETEQIPQPAEPVVPTEEETPATEPVADSVDQDSLTLKIIVEVEPDQAPPTFTSAEADVEASSGEELNPASSELPSSATEETSSSTPEVAPDDSEQTSSSPATTIEHDHTLPASDKSEGIIPSTENEKNTPSNDTGEKTLA